MVSYNYYLGSHTTPAAPMFPGASSSGLNRNGDFSTALISAVNTVFDSTPRGEKLIN